MSYGALVPNDPAIASRATRIATLSLRLNDARAAADWFERAAAASPNDLGLLALLADAHLRAGNRDAAQVTITRGLEKDPKNTALLTLARRIRM
jgi:predicted Zn-dependent protease